MTERAINAPNGNKIREKTPTNKESHSEAPRAAWLSLQSVGCLSLSLTELDTYPFSVLRAPVRCSIRVKVVPTAKRKGSR